VHPLDVRGVAHERQRDDVGAGAQTPAQVVLVLLAQRGHVHGDTGQVDALVVRDRAGDDDLGGHDRAVGVDDLDAHIAVVDQQEIAGLDVLGKALERGAADLAVADDVLGGDLEDVTDLELVRAVLEAAETDLRPLQVDQHGDGSTRVLSGTTHVGVVGIVHGVVAVAEVQTGDVDPRVDQGTDLLIGRGCRAECGDDLRASQHHLQGKRA